MGSEMCIRDRASPQARFLGPAERKGPPEPDSSALARFQAPGGKPTREIPWPCRAKRRSRARFLGPGEVSGPRVQENPKSIKRIRPQAPGELPRPCQAKINPRADSSALARFQAPGPRLQRPQAPGSMRILRPCQAKMNSRPWRRSGPRSQAPRSRPQAPGEFPRPCRTKMSSIARFL